MKIKIMEILKNKIKIFLFMMLKPKMVILKRRNHLHLMKNNKKGKIMKNLKLLRKKALNHLLRRTRRGR